MLDQRSKGIITLHGCCVVAALNLLFFVQAVLGVELTDRFSYELINFPLYFMGITACGIIFFNFYPILSASLFQQTNARVFQVTNMQAAVLLLMMFGIIFATKDKAISRVFVATYLILAYVTLFSLNLFLPKMFSRLLFKGGNVRRCLAIGDPQALARINDWLTTKKNLGMQVIGLVCSGERASCQKSDDFIGCVDELPELVRSHYINQILLLETRQSKTWVRSVMQVAEEEGCQVIIYNPWAEYFDQPLISIKDGPHTFFIPREEPLESPFNRLLKRSMDLVVSIPILLLVLPPVMLWAWLRIRRESPGPLFFKQKRTGYNRATFTIYKFRSMHVANDDESRQASKEDPRVFKFGQFIRKTSLDELPQFWNVFKGDMSLVGPRPHLPEHDALFGKTVRIYPQRHFVKPGITGFAQCQGFRGEITDPEKLRLRINFDVEYITEWSIWLDIEIMARTAWILLHPSETAY